MTNNEIQERVAKAMELFKSKYNCAQAVACAFSDKTDISEEMMFRITEGFGHGMGSFDGTCGALSAACVLSGLKNSTAHLAAPDSKQISEQEAKKCLLAFKEKNGAVTCRELKGLDTGTPLRGCGGCIKDAVTVIAENLYE